MSYKDLYSEVKKRKMEALNKGDIVKAVEKHGRILAVEGRFEKPKKVVNNMYAATKRVIKPNHILKFDLEDYDLLLIGCPGDQIPEKALIRIKVFVQNGGWLLTTDWAIVSILEKIFPGYIRWNGIKTADAVVACQLNDPYHAFLDGVATEIQRNKWSAKSSKNTAKNEFRWWLETKSYPIDVINKHEVHVLISSRELKYKWGEDPVLCYFNIGDQGGRVIHIISHTHLQKGGEKGKYASALILTNILDEKISVKMGISKKPAQGYVSDWTQPQAQSHQSYSPSSMGDDWLNPPDQNNYLTPSMDRGTFPGSMPENAGLTGTSQIIEADQSSFSLNTNCVYCGLNFNGSSGKIYVCQECKAAYHEGCLNNQINEGICKNCNKILLW